jgi:hypothetical protein
MSAGDAAGVFLDSIVKNFQAQKRLAERAIVQLSDEQLRTPLDPNTNSVAVIMKHMAGNLRSRFADFLTSDGEKPDRDRDGEFVDTFPSRDAMMEHWERGWRVLFDTLASLRPEDLTKSVTIRGEPHSVIDALHRALAHQGYHVGQIVQLSRHLANDRWNTITIPRGGSVPFNQQKLSEQRNP